jgi:hypothetical protein
MTSRLFLIPSVLILCTVLVAAFRPSYFPSTSTLSKINGLRYLSPTKIQTRRQLLSYDDLAEEMPSQAVIKACDSFTSSSRNGDKKIIVASDIASAAGVSLSQARKDLTKLAALTLGDIAVSKEGELLYSFPSSVSSVLLSNSLKYRITHTFRTKVWPVLFYAIRVSFGLTLIASIALIYSTIAFISTSSSSSSDNDRDERNNYRGSFERPMGGGIFGPSPFDFFYYRPYYGYSSYQLNNNAPQEMGFLESVFSYIFGDGNPNMDLEEKRLRLASNVIRENQGAVTAEQLAPFCDNVPLIAEGNDESSVVEERFVLPIISRLGGEPTVTDEGNIVYVFPDMQVSAVESAGLNSELLLEKLGLQRDATAREIKRQLQLAGIDVRGALDKADLVQILKLELPDIANDDDDAVSLLQEKEIKFSAAGDIQRILAGILGAVNLLGALYLGNILASPSLQGVQLPSYFGLVQTSYPFLLIYAILFNAIPLARSFWIKRENQNIRERNRARRSWYTLVQSNIGRASGRIARKLRSAQQFGLNMRRLGKNKSDIVYDTSKDIADIEAVKEEQSLQEFDQRVMTHKTSQANKTL